MLRAVVRRSVARPYGLDRAAVGSQSQSYPRRVINSRRPFADEKSPSTSSVSSNASNTTNPATPSSTTPIPPAKAPQAPTAPQKIQTAPPTSIPPNPASVSSPISSSGGSSSPPPPPPKKGRIRRFFLVSIFTLGIAYAGGVYYALVSDDFHEYFVDYAPWGEDVVLFFEERQFRRKFPDGVGGSSKFYPQVSGENKVTIAGKSGASARVAGSQSTDSTPSGRHNSALDATSSAKGQSASQTTAQAEPVKGATSNESAKEAAKQKAKEEAPSTTLKQSSDKTAQPEKKSASTKSEAKKADSDKKPASTAAKKDIKGPAVTSASSATTAAPSEPSEFAKTSTSSSPSSSTMTTTPSATPIPSIDALNIENASDPVVQKVSKILNDVITVINADNASAKFSSAMDKAKEDLRSLAGELDVYRATESKAAAEKIKETESSFDKQAEEILNRVQQEQKEQELRWREEYEAERERLSTSYQTKIKAEVEATQKVADQKLQNELLQQNIQLQEAFAQSVRQRIENEREARLSKLEELSSAVSELESLTGQWNEVVDANLQTQHLVVAVDAVRAALEDADRPKPFLHELAALKEIAQGDRVIDAAIASIEPSAYQRGVPTSGQLVDRFRQVAAEVRKAALLPEDAGVASHAASFFLSKLLFKKEGMAMGDDVESILTRTERLLEEGELDEAAREMNGLTGWAKVLSQDWLRDCRRVLEVKQALEVISTEARLQSLALQ